MSVLQTGVNSASKRKKRGGGLRSNQRIFLIVMLAIPIIQWVVFWLLININSVILAFQTPSGDWSLNSLRVFWDGLTYRGNEINVAIINTLIYFANSLAIILPLSLVICYFIYKKIMFHKAFRVIIYLPAIISAVAMVSVFKNFITPGGALDSILGLFGGNVPVSGLLGDSRYATPTIVVYCIWTGFAGNILLLGGAMSRIPEEVIESARIEGCSPFRELISIIMPLIWPTISTMLVFLLTGIFNSSGPILLMTNGNNQTTTLAFWIFNQVYGSSLGGGGSYNVVAAAGLCFTLVGVPLILGARALMEKIPAVEY